MIIGLTGSFGAGKGAVVEYLVDKKGFRHFSVRSFLIDELKRRGRATDRDAMIELANELRSKHSPSYILETLFKKAETEGGNAVIESIRAVAEAKFIKDQGGIIIGIDAEPMLRYARSRGRGSETDEVTFEEWKAQEVKETNPEDPTKQDIFGALRESDFILENNGTLPELYSKIESVLETIDKR